MLFPLKYQFSMNKTECLNNSKSVNERLHIWMKDALELKIPV